MNTSFYSTNLSYYSRPEISDNLQFIPSGCLLFTHLQNKFSALSFHTLKNFDKIYIFEKITLQTLFSKHEYYTCEMYRETTCF